MKQPLRLLLWHWGRHGGGPRYTYELAKALKELPGIETHLSLSRQCEIADHFADLQMPTLWVDTYTNTASCMMRTMAVPVLAWRMRRYLRAHRIDVVDSTMTHLWTRLVTPFLRASRRRLICTVHDATLHPGEFSHLKDWFYAPVPRVDHYITLTNFVADRLEQIHAISRDRMDVIPHGVNAQFAPVPPVPRRPGEPLRLLFFGRLLPYKGLDRLLRAYKQLVGQGHPLTLTIAGSGELEDDTAQLIARLPGVTLHQRWISEEDIPGFLADADCVVLPYVEASQSGVVPAAFAAGVTAIVTPVGGLPEQVSHDHDGLVTESTSPSALAAAILRLLEDPHLLPRLRAGASQSAVNDFSWAKIAENLAEIALASLNRKP